MYRITLYFFLFFIALRSFAAAPPKREFRAVWVSTVYNLDWPSSNKISAEEQKKEFIYLLEKSQKNGMNAVIVQVRTSADAFYKSSYEPWSRYLTGTQGKDPGYDPLQFMVNECHSRNMEFHAWFNLFRGVPHSRFIEVAEDHITHTRPEWFFDYKNGKFFNPGIPQVRNYLVNVITEVVKNYDIDGVHLDDYFYPINEDADNKIHDKKTFKENRNGFRNIEDWRRNNVDLIVEELHRKIKETKNYVKFGISPFPVWRHKYDDRDGSQTDRTLTCYDHYYADTRKWMKNGWVDYMAPQFYWGTEFRKLPFYNLISWWSEHSFNRPVYAGLAYYKVAGDEVNPLTDPSWIDTTQIFQQMDLIRNMRNFSGCCFYREGNFNRRTKPYTNRLNKEYFNTPALQPSMPWLDSIPPKSPSNLNYTMKGDSVILSWEKPIGNVQDLAYAFVIYSTAATTPISFNSGEHIRTITNKTTWTIASDQIKGHIIYVRSLDRLHNESLNFVGLYIPSP